MVIVSHYQLFTEEIKMKVILKKTAKEFGVPVSEVRSEIDKAIEIGMSDPDPLAQEKWKSIPCEGDKPTAEELIAWAYSQIKNQNIS